MLSRLAMSLAFMLALATITPGAAARGKAGKRASKLFKQGVTQLDQGRYAQALGLLEKSAKLKPRPEAYLHMGHCHAGLNDCRRAVDAFERYLKDAPKGKHRADAQAAIDRCKAATTGPPSQPVPQPEEIAPQQPPVAKPEREPDRTTEITQPGASDAVPTTAASDEPVDNDFGDDDFGDDDFGDDDFGDDDFGDDDFGDDDWSNLGEPAEPTPWYGSPWFWSTVGGVLAVGAGAAALSL